MFSFIRIAHIFVMSEDCFVYSLTVICVEVPQTALDPAVLLSESLRIELRVHLIDVGVSRGRSFLIIKYRDLFIPSGGIKLTYFLLELKDCVSSLSSLMPSSMKMSCFV